MHPVERVPITTIGFWREDRKNPAPPHLDSINVVQLLVGLGDGVLHRGDLLEEPAEVHNL